MTRAGNEAHLVGDLLIRFDEIHEAGIDDGCTESAKTPFLRSRQDRGRTSPVVVLDPPEEIPAFGNVGTQRPVHLRGVPTDVIEVRVRTQDEIDRCGIETRSGEPGHEVSLQVTPSGKRSRTAVADTSVDDDPLAAIPRPRHAPTSGDCRRCR